MTDYGPRADSLTLVGEYVPGERARAAFVEAVAAGADREISVLGTAVAAVGDAWRTGSQTN